MAIETGIARAAAITGGGPTQTFTDGNMTQTVNAALFVGVAATVDGTPASDVAMSIGAADSGLNQFVSCIQDEDGQLTTDTGRRGATDECIMFLTQTGSIDGEANISSFGTGSVTVNWGSLPGTAWLITVYLFSVDNAEAGTLNPSDSIGGTVTVTPSFQSTLIFGVNHGQQYNDSFNNNAQLSFGMCDENLNQGHENQESATGQGSTSLRFRIRNDSFSGAIATGADTWHEITSITATTFVVTTRNATQTNMRVGYLALDTGDRNTFVDNVAIPNSAVETDYNVGFASQIAGFVQGLGEADNTTYTNDLANSFGASAATENDEFTQMSSSDDGAGTTVTRSLSDNQIIAILDPPTTLDIEATFVSFTSPNVTVDFSNVATNAKRTVIWAIEAEGAPAPTPGTIGFVTAGTETFSKPTYELWLTDGFGNRLAQLTTFLSLEASRVANQIGFFNMTMPPSFDINLIQPDRMVQLWRAPRGGRLALWRVYFIRKWEFSVTGSDELVSFGGPDVNDLLRRRIVAAFTASAQAGKTDFADDMMKEIVTEAIADGIAPTPDAGTRVWADLSIASDLGLGPTITKSFPFKKLLTTSGQGVLPGLAKAAKEAGTEVFFDIVPDEITGSSASYQFQTFTGQPGQDHTSRVVFAAIRSNIGDPRLEYDYTEEENYIYAGGQGEEDDRNIQQVSDSDRFGVSQWARIEGFADARNQKPDDGVREAGRDKLNVGRPRIRFSAIPLDVKGTRFMRDWDYGDKVTARFRNIEFDTIIRAVTISVDGDGNESIGARLDFEN